MDKLLHISEEHIGANASSTDGYRIVDLMRCQGWPVVYGDRPWQFEDEESRLAFEKAFQWALNVLKVEKGETDQETWETLAKQRIQVDEALRPYAQQFEKGQSWARYWQWLVTAPSDVILKWLEIENKKDVPKE